MDKELYEVVEMMGNNSVLQGDVNLAAGIIKKMLRDKYVAPIQKAITAENKKVRKNPCKEARLLEALKPFVDTARHDSLERTIEMLHTINTLRGLQNSTPLKPARTAALEAAAPQEQTISAQDSSVHTDGIYDVDENCLRARQAPPQQTPFLLLMIMAMHDKRAKAFVEWKIDN